MSHSITVARNESGFRIGNGNAHPFLDGFEAGHHDPAALVFFIPEHLDRALAARADRAQGRMPAKIRHLVSEREADAEEVFTPIDFMGPAFNVDSRHVLSPWTAAPFDVGLEVLAEEFQGAAQRLDRARGEGTERPAGGEISGVHLEKIEIAGPPLSGLDGPRIFATQGRPSRHGVHQPQDSRGEETLEVEDESDRAGPVVKNDGRPRSEAAADFHFMGKIKGTSNST